MKDSENVNDFSMPSISSIHRTVIEDAKKVKLALSI